MRKHWIAALALVVALGIPAVAKDKGQKHENGQGNKHADKHDHDWKDKDDDDRGWEKHDRYEMRTFARGESYPRGWSKGRKTGWRDCGLPPGQAKKYGCYTYVYSRRRYYYYHDDGGRLIIRRPLIHISGDVVVR
jgi:hypothetical protein